MMISSPCIDNIKIFNRLKDAVSMKRVTLQDVNFIPCQFCRFLQNFQRDGKFTQVVEIASDLHHLALPLGKSSQPCQLFSTGCNPARMSCRDRKSTRLNSSHSQISYAVFCLVKRI